MPPMTRALARRVGALGMVDVTASPTVQPNAANAIVLLRATRSASVAVERPFLLQVSLRAVRRRCGRNTITLLRHENAVLPRNAHEVPRLVARAAAWIAVIARRATKIPGHGRSRRSADAWHHRVQPVAPQRPLVGARPPRAHRAPHRHRSGGGRPRLRCAAS